MKAAKLEITAEQAEALLARVKSAMTEDDFRIIKGLVDTHQLLQQAVLEKATSIQRLLRMIFGGKTEKTTNPQANRVRQAEKKPVKGHGKIGAGLYPGGVQQRIHAGSRFYSSGASGTPHLSNTLPHYIPSVESHPLLGAKDHHIARSSMRKHAHHALRSSVSFSIMEHPWKFREPLPHWNERLYIHHYSKGLQGASQSGLA